MARPFVRVAGLLALAAGDAAAQDATAVQRPGWLVGGSVGVPAYGGDAAPDLFTLGVHWTQLRPNRPGADLALGTLPRAVAEGVFAVGVRAGAALPLALAPRVVLLPSAGVSLLGGFGGGGAGGTAGYHTGVAAVLLGPRGSGLRAGVTWHRFGQNDRAIWLWELGVVRGPSARSGTAPAQDVRRAGG